MEAATSAQYDEYVHAQAFGQRRRDLMDYGKALIQKACGFRFWS